MIRKFLCLITLPVVFSFLCGTAFAAQIAGAEATFSRNLSGAGWSNITTFDGMQSTDDPWYGPQEDDEVEDGHPNDGNVHAGAPTNDFDLEAIFYNAGTKELAIVSGYDFAYGSISIQPGDIFINTSTQNFALDMAYETDISYDTNAYHTQDVFYAATLGYSLFSGSGIVSSNPGDTLPPTTVPFVPIPEAGPYRYLSGGTPGPAGSAGYYHGINQSLWGTSFGGTYHNILLIDVSWLNDDVFSVRNTLQDGNDLIIGTIPEPATLLLFGAGLLGVAGLNRRKKS